jgi:hypothetical protein
VIITPEQNERLSNLENAVAKAQARVTEARTDLKVALKTLVRFQEALDEYRESVGLGQQELPLEEGEEPSTS